MKALIKIKIFGAYARANVIGLRPLVGGALLGVAAPIKSALRLFFFFFIFYFYWARVSPSLFFTDYFALRLFFFIKKKEGAGYSNK